MPGFSQEHSMNEAKNKHEGKIVSVSGDTLKTTCSQGKEHEHTVADDAKVTCDGKTCKASDLKAGTDVRVTTHRNDKSIATAIDSGKHVTSAAGKT
jgi:hypothetical protein